MNLAYALKHPTSRVVLRWVRWFGSYKRLVIALMRRCPRKINMQTEWVARLQLARKCCIDAKSDNNRKPLHWASYQGHTSVAKSLIYAGADVDARDNHNMTPLHLASCYGHAPVIKILIRSGACVNAKDKNNWTPLFAASFYDYTSIVEEFICAGADVNAKNNKNRTPLDIASSRGHTSVVKLLRAAMN